MSHNGECQGEGVVLQQTSSQMGLGWSYAPSLSRFVANGGQLKTWRSNLQVRRSYSNIGSESMQLVVSLIKELVYCYMQCTIQNLYMILIKFCLHISGVMFRMHGLILHITPPGKGNACLACPHSIMLKFLSMSIYICIYFQFSILYDACFK